MHPFRTVWADAPLFPGADASLLDGGGAGGGDDAGADAPDAGGSDDVASADAGDDVADANGADAGDPDTSDADAGDADAGDADAVDADAVDADAGDADAGDADAVDADAGDADPDVPTCSDECDVLGASECVGPARLRTCGDFDDDACLELGEVELCTDGWSCDAGVCSPPANQPPDLPDLTLTVREETPIAINLAEVDSDGDRLTFSIVGGPDSGVLEGAFPSATYTPNRDFFGLDVIELLVYDGIHAGVALSVRLEVQNTQDPPEGEDARVSTVEDVALDVVLPARDADGDDLTFTLDTDALAGVLVGEGPALRFEPLRDANGETAFTWTVFDGSESAGPFTMTIDIAPANDPPSVVTTALEAVEDEPLAFVLEGADVDGDDVRFELVQGARRGSLSLESDGRGTFLSAPNDDGAESFTVRATDGVAQSPEVEIPIRVASVNDAPTIEVAGGSVEAGASAELAITASDAEGHAFVVEIFASPMQASAEVIDAGASVRIDADLDGRGEDSVQLVAREIDASLLEAERRTSAPATGTFTIVGNEAPDAVDDMYRVGGNSTLVVAAEDGLLDNDIDREGNDLAVTSNTVRSLAGVEVEIASDGSFSYAWPAGSRAASDSFEYQVSDGELSATGRVQINRVGMVWWVDASAAPGGFGTQDQPYQAPLDFLFAPAAIGDYVALGEGRYDTLGAAYVGDVQVVGPQHDIEIDGLLIRPGVPSASKPEIFASLSGGWGLQIGGTSPLLRGVRVVGSASGVALSVADGATNVVLDDVTIEQREASATGSALDVGAVDALTLTNSTVHADHGDWAMSTDLVDELVITSSSFQGGALAFDLVQVAVGTRALIRDSDFSTTASATELLGDLLRVDLADAIGVELVVQNNTGSAAAPVFGFVNIEPPSPNLVPGASFSALVEDNALTVDEGNCTRTAYRVAARSGFTGYEASVGFVENSVSTRCEQYDIYIRGAHGPTDRLCVELRDNRLEDILLASFDGVREVVVPAGTLSTIEALQAALATLNPGALVEVWENGGFARSTPCELPLIGE